MDKLEGFQIVKEARAMLRSMPAREVNEATAREYRKTFDFLKNENISPEENTSCKNTYYKRRAAINYICTKFLKEALTEQDRAQKQGDWKEWCRQLDIIQDCLHYLKKFPQQKEMGEGLKKGNVCTVSDPKPRKSKRQSLKRMPEDWRDKMFQECPWESKYLSMSII